MQPEPVGRAIRVGGVTVEPGESRTVSLLLPGRGARPPSGARSQRKPRPGAEPEPEPDDAGSATKAPPGPAPAGASEDSLQRIPAQVTVGLRAGPRLTILAAPRGFEAAAAAAATEFSTDAAAGQLDGSVVVIPVLRPGGRFAAGGRPVREAALWQFPGDVGGSRRQREAFTIFSETCVGASVVVLLTAPRPGRVGLPMARGDLDDPRFRRLSLHAGLPVVVHTKVTAGALGAAARDAGNTLIELVAPRCEATPEAVSVLLGALRRLGDLIGLTPASLAMSTTTTMSTSTYAQPHPNGGDSVVGGRSPTPRPASFTQLIAVGAEVGGLTEVLVRPGQAVKRDEVLAYATSTLSRATVPIVAPRDAVVIEAPDARVGRLGVRRGATLFRLAGGGRAARARVVQLTASASRARSAEGDGGAPSASAAHAAHSHPAHSPPSCSPSSSPSSSAREQPDLGVHTTRIGWVERVSLPLLGIDRLKAKIDTGARTSALHVSRMRPVGTTAGPHRRAILEITIPNVGKNGRQTLVVRAHVREHVQVKDTSGRTERRPVIETSVRLGAYERRIRVTLTDRGDMLFPMLIGRTALGPGIVVDPARRYLVPVQPPAAARTRAGAGAKKRRRAAGGGGRGPAERAAGEEPAQPDPPKAS